MIWNCKNCDLMLSDQVADCKQPESGLCGVCTLVEELQEMAATEREHKYNTTYFIRYKRMELPGPRVDLIGDEESQMMRDLKAGARERNRRLFEGGPGIAALKPKQPDNSLDWLDEDLLCADEDER